MSPAMRRTELKRQPWGQSKAKQRSKAEQRFQGRIQDLAQHLGWFPFHILHPMGSPAGFPDLVLFRERVVWMELKAYSDNTGKAGGLSQEQERFHDMLREAGQEVYVFWDDSDSLEQIKKVLAKPGVPQ